MVKINYIKSVTVVHDETISCFDEGRKAEELSNALEVTAESATFEFDCEKCRFHDAAHFDETLGWICPKCRNWFAKRVN